MRTFVFLLTTILFVNYVHAQTAEDSVKAAVNKLFTGMKNADATIVASSFADSAVLQTISKNKAGNIVVMNETVASFAEFVGKQAKGAADERIQFETIKIDGPLAMVWAPYLFYYNGKFSHCGVDSFQLVRTNGEWKIVYLIDTRRKQGCNPE